MAQVVSHNARSKHKKEAARVARCMWRVRFMARPRKVPLEDLMFTASITTQSPSLAQDELLATSINKQTQLLNTTLSILSNGFG
ncbi:hypothetical protein F511_19269 [Dorcoceras hygrometricum]|uniref:Uncharacterized protein n=1 Tax=Dorcoceras hygrometricum TaxID=472368 RepID=A0A2Z7CW02_9LAMI|nr:hypothetical protein F511_19269 [Dorcoceras hygrometricum]